MNLKKLKQIEPYAVGYLCAEPYNSVEYRVASGLYALASEMPLTVRADDFFVGEHTFTTLYGVDTRYCQAIVFNEERFLKNAEAHPELSEELAFVREKMAPLDSDALYYGALSEAEKDLRDLRICWGGGWGGHGNPNYDTLLSLGTTALKAKIEAYKEKRPERADFYAALSLSLSALEVWGERYRLEVLSCMERAEESQRAHLLRIAEALEQCPKKPPRDFFEASQMFWLAFVFMGVDSPGRFDMFMYPYYEESKREEARLCIEKLWELFYETRTWNLCIGGSDASGKDTSNAISYLILETAAKYRYHTPNLTMRVHPETSPELLRLAILSIASGTGMPTFYNDECVCPALEALGIPTDDAHEYCMNGCNQIDIMGKSHMGLEDGEVSLIKCLELTLRDGVCSVSGKKLGLGGIEPDKILTFEELLRLYERQVEYITDCAAEMSNKSQRIHAAYGPNPFRSALIDGCIEKGQDYRCGGPLYNHGQILAEGIADTADSLVAIKHFVFDTKKYTLAELISALDADFVGYEALYRDFSTYKKFGNDDEEVDALASHIVRHFFTYLRTKSTYRGGIFTGGCSPFKRVALYGAKVGAMPNGKRRGDPLLADSIGATPGNDKKGLTALLNSALTLPHELAASGFILQVKLDKSIVERPQGIALVTALIRAYFADGGQQLSFTIVSAEELLDAVEHPERHGGLIVRVGGYSDYFINLTPELQANILRRCHYTT